MMKKIALLILLCATQIETKSISFKEKIQKIHNLCIPLILQYEILEMQQNNQPQPTPETFNIIATEAQKSYDKQIEKLPAKKIKQIKKLLRALKTISINDLKSLLTLLYGEEEATIILLLLQQFAQQESSKFALLKQAIEAIRSNKTFSEYILEQRNKTLQFVQSAAPNEIEQAEKMLTTTNQAYSDMFGTIALNIFKENC